MILYVYASVYVYVYFFFKQKTAYDMRISDWISDVCSSDLLGSGEAGAGEREPDGAADHHRDRTGGVHQDGRGHADDMGGVGGDVDRRIAGDGRQAGRRQRAGGDRKSTRLNSSH